MTKCKLDQSRVTVLTNCLPSSQHRVGANRSGACAGAGVALHREGLALQGTATSDSKCNTHPPDLSQPARELVFHIDAAVTPRSGDTLRHRSRRRLVKAVPDNHVFVGNSDSCVQEVSYLPRDVIRVALGKEVP